MDVYLLSDYTSLGWQLRISMIFSLPLNFKVLFLSVSALKCSRHGTGVSNHIRHQDVTFNNKYPDIIATGMHLSVPEPHGSSPYRQDSYGVGLFVVLETDGAFASA